MRYRLVVTGADNAIREQSFNPIATRLGLTWKQAAEWKEVWIEEWQKMGFVLTPAGIYVRGSEWRRVSIHEELERMGDEIPSVD